MRSQKRKKLHYRTEETADENLRGSTLYELTCSGTVSLPITTSPPLDKGTIFELGRGGNDALSSVGVETVGFTGTFLTSLACFSPRNF